VWAKDGTRSIVREGSGAARGFARTVGEAMENAIKAPETDAMKRALVTFGDQFGLTLYDKAQRNVAARGSRAQIAADGEAAHRYGVRAAAAATDLAACSGHRQPAARRDRSARLSPSPERLRRRYCQETADVFWALTLFIGSSVFMLLAPFAIKRAHVRRQNDLLARCRALFVLAVQALELANERAARSYLVRIRRLEVRWRYGNSRPFRIALATWAIGIGVVGFLLLRALALLPFDRRTPTADDVRRLADLVPLIPVFGAFASICAGGFYLDHWTHSWVIDDCGDRGRPIRAGPRRPHA
jgi:hypothetical protein